MQNFHTDKVNFNYNSDFSGDFIIDDLHGAVMKVPGLALLQLVANFTREKKIARLEQAAFTEVLGIDPLAHP